ncbi:MAG: N-acetylmuramoyl-L-alanine amidase [Candidatus Babeliales bacterium]
MPIKTIFFLFFLLLTPCYNIQSFTLMLDPAGHAKYEGREIDDCFERGLTLQCAEALKKNLNELYPYVHVVLSRSAGQTVEHLQNAHIANRMKTDLYLSIHFYQEKEEKPSLYLYQFLYNTATDFWPYVDNGFSFIPYKHAYRAHTESSYSYGTNLLQFFNKKKYKRYFDCKGFFGLPCKPLLGINCPALLIEAGLKKRNDWHCLAEALVDALETIINPDAS